MTALTSTATMTLIATRKYALDGFHCADLLWRTAKGGFKVQRTTNGHPDEPDHEIKMTKRQVFQ